MNDLSNQRRRPDGRFGSAINPKVPEATLGSLADVAAADVDVDGPGRFAGRAAGIADSYDNIVDTADVEAALEAGWDPDVYVDARFDIVWEDDYEQEVDFDNTCERRSHGDIVAAVHDAAEYGVDADTMMQALDSPYYRNAPDAWLAASRDGYLEQYRALVGEYNKGGAPFEAANLAAEGFTGPDVHVYKKVRDSGAKLSEAVAMTHRVSGMTPEDRSAASRMFSYYPYDTVSKALDDGFSPTEYSAYRSLNFSTRTDTEARALRDQVSELRPDASVEQRVGYARALGSYRDGSSISVADWLDVADAGADKEVYVAWRTGDTPHESALDLMAGGERPAGFSREDRSWWTRGT